MNIDVCFSPLLYSAYKEKEQVVIVVDVFRATTTMCVALANGATCIIPVESIEIAKEYKDRGYLVGGERNVKKVNFADFGNTPSEYSPEKVKGHDIVLSTTNGTHSIETAKDCDTLIIGAFSNLSAVADFCISKNKDILILCSGWKDKFNIEDTLFGGALAQLLIDKSAGLMVHSDAVEISLSMWGEAKNDVYTYIQKSEHIKRLEANNLLDVARYCLKIDTAHVVPVYNKEENKIKAFH